MRNLMILVILMIGSGINSKAQNRSGAYGIEVISTASVYNYTYRVSINPLLVIKNQQQRWEVGPMILVLSNLGSNISGGPTISGLRGAYSFLPQTSNNRYAFYLGGEIQLQRFKDVWQANAFDPTKGQFVDLPYRNVELLAEGYAGYGIQLKIGNQWYLTKGIGAGVYYSMLKGDELSVDAPEIDSFDYRGYDNFGFAWKVKVGVGYVF